MKKRISFFVSEEEAAVIKRFAKARELPVHEWCKESVYLRMRAIWREEARAAQEAAAGPNYPEHLMREVVGEQLYFDEVVAARWRYAAKLGGTVDKVELIDGSYRLERRKNDVLTSTVMASSNQDAETILRGTCNAREHGEDLAFGLY